MGQAQNDQLTRFTKAPMGAKGYLGRGVKMKVENDANKIEVKINQNSCPPRAYSLISDYDIHAWESLKTTL